MINRLKHFIYEFNNLCRRDNRILSWAIYIEETMLKIDINFINYNSSIYPYHIVIDTYELKQIRQDLKSFAIYWFMQSQRAFENEQLIGGDSK